MINKLMKYDIKKMTKVLKYFYFISIGLAIISRLINIKKDIQVVAILGQVFMGMTIAAIVNILVNTFIHILKVFLTDFYKDESYLTHTLPINKNKLLLSKYLSALIVIVASFIVCFISLFIMFYSKSFMLSLKSFVELSISGYNLPIGSFVALIALILFVQICCIISMAFTTIVKANTYNQKRILKGLLWLAVYYFGAMIMIIILAVIIFALMGNLPALLAPVLSQNAFITILVIVLVMYLIYSFLYYYLCNKLFNKGVNVD